MLSSFLFSLKAAVVLVLLLLNTLLWMIPLLLLIPFKAASPTIRWRNGCTRQMRRLALGWGVVMNALWRLRTPDDLDVELPLQVGDQRGWYLLLCNHQSWIDILVLIRLFARRLPFPVFFAKKELLRLPIFGQVMWGLDFPLVERYSRQEVQRRPELRWRDLQTVRTACERARQMPTTLIIFPEGTRFTFEKNREQGSPYRHLLSPKPGGTTVALTTLGERLSGVLDLTIAYPQGCPSLFEVFVGKSRPVIVRGRMMEVPPELKQGSYADDTISHQHKEWLEDIWRQKDELLSRLLSESNQTKQLF